MILTIVLSTKDRGKDDYLAVDEQYREILQKGIDNPMLLDPLLTCKYDKLKESDRSFYLKYCSYAYIVWNFLETIYDFSNSKKKSKFLQIWLPAVLEENKLHFRWFINNDILFETQFRNYVYDELNGILVEEGNIHDFEKVYQIMKTEFPTEEMKDEKQLIKVLAQGKYKIFLAKRKKCTPGDKSFVGYALGYVDENSNGLFLDYINILKEYQNCGYGSLFIKELLQNILVGENPLGIVFEIEKPDENPNSIKNRRLNFYRRLGAHKIDVQYFLPTINGKIPLDLMAIPNPNKKIIKKECLQNFISSAILSIHSDYKYTREILESYVNDIKDIVITGNLEIAKGNTEDLDTIYEFLEMNFDENFKISKHEFVHRLKLGNYELFIAKNTHGSLVGYAFLYYGKNNKFVFLDYFSINPFFRKLGYAGEFLEEIKKKAFEISEYGLFSEYGLNEHSYVKSFVSNHGGVEINATYFYPCEIDYPMQAVAFLKPSIKKLDDNDTREFYSEILKTLHPSYVNDSNVHDYIRNIRDLYITQKKKMKRNDEFNFEYFLDVKNNIVYAYGNNSNFFNYFDKAKQDLIISENSFKVMIRDYKLIQLNQDEAYKLINNVLPDKRYKEFCDFSEKNLSAKDCHIDWEEVDKEAKRCLKICMEMDELDKN